MTGYGTVDLVETTVNYTTDAEILDIPDLTVDDTIREYCNPIRVNITGTLSDPVPRPDIGACIENRARRELKEKEEELQDKVKEKLKDKLKDLFGQ